MPCLGRHKHEDGPVQSKRQGTRQGNALEASACDVIIVGAHVDHNSSVYMTRKWRRDLGHKQSLDAPLELTKEGPSHDYLYRTLSSPTSSVQQRRERPEGEMDMNMGRFLLRRSPMRMTSEMSALKENSLDLNLGAMTQFDAPILWVRHAGIRQPRSDKVVVRAV